MSISVKADKKVPILSVAAPRTEAVGACPLCDSRKCSHRFCLSDRYHSVPGKFTYRQCQDCRTVFQDPRVITEDLPICYPDDYLTHKSSNETQPPIVEIATLQANFTVRGRLRQAVIAAVRQESMSGMMRWFGVMLAKSRRLRERAFYSFVLDEMLPFRSGKGYALEVGCGAGHLLRALKQVGWNVEGVEWDTKAAEVAKRTSNLTVRVGDFQELDIPQGKYDLVVLHHVIEHLPNTKVVLGKIESVLAPGGRAVLVYPNPDSLGARAFRENWVSWDPPRHLVIPPAKTLVKVAKSVGLDLQRLRSTARSAEWSVNLSRAYKRDESFNSTGVRISFYDRFFVLLERVLIGIGLKIGEELIVVLEKPQLS